MLKRATVTGSTMRGRTAAEKQQIAERCAATSGRCLRQGNASR